MKRKSFKSISSLETGARWRLYQRRLQQRKTVRPALKVLFLLVVLLGAAYGLVDAIGGDSFSFFSTGSHAPLATSKRVPAREAMPAWGKEDVRQLLDGNLPLNLRKRRFSVVQDGTPLHVETTLDMQLQRTLLDALNTAHARYIGIVAMNPANGSILAMVSYDKDDPTHNTTINSAFPAASIFKIVTAVAAIQEHGYHPDQAVYYNGRKYTLYKSQLKERRTRWTRKTSFRESFGLSINPVFGKIGAGLLGKPILESYARTFGFNEPIDFEAPVSMSRIVVEDDPYQWAEIASGFNRTTRISPLHAAVIGASIVNGGLLVEPTMVARITDGENRLLYHHQARTVRSVMSREATTKMQRLMAETIRSGTCRKTFRGYRKDPVLSQLELGGKTGSISNGDHDARFDWFVGFAVEKRGDVQMVLSIVVAHEDYIGVRASQYAREAFKQYFQEVFAQRKGRESQG
ncbi:MAG: PbpA [Desulfobacteraceae bacterium]|nr:PbpA [Desulfobacteraceae bacterium]